MNRTVLLRIHLGATGTATFTIACFFGFSLAAELIGEVAFIVDVKTVILYCLPVLVVAMPALALSGKKLAGKSKDPLVSSKLKRMKMIAANGVVLVSLAVYLFYHATYKTIDATFIYVQVAELVFGGTNLLLIGMNIRDGLRLSGRLGRNGTHPSDAVAR